MRLPRVRSLPFALLVASVLHALPSTSAAQDADDIRDAVNEMRARGCGGAPGRNTRLRANRHVNAMAEALARGARLKQVVSDENYRALRSASIHISRAVDEAAVKRTLRAQFCAEAVDPDFEHIGVARRGLEAWVVVTKAFDAPAVRDAPEISRRMLMAVNAARSKARRCGSDPAPAAGPVRLSGVLERAARAHAADVANQGRMSHIGSDGSTPSQRATRANYAWRAVGENVAAGQTTPEAAVQSWLESPGHCTNLMGARFTEMGIAYAVDLESPDGIYWVQLLATPR